jgi:hypothetical protein
MYIWRYELKASSQVKQLFYSLFGYRFIYLGMSTRNLGRIKIGIARNVRLRWKAIDKDMKGRQFPIFSLPCFHALWFEQHLHRVMRRFNRPVEGDGGSEFFTYTNPFSWIGWLYVIAAMIIAFLISHLLIYLTLTYAWCWYKGSDFMEFQMDIVSFVTKWI